MSCGGEKNSLRATGVFALVYILAGALITSVGIYTMKHLPELFTTGSVIWSGIIVSFLGITMMAFVCCGSLSFQKGMVVAVIAGIIMVVSIINIVLLETIEWKYGIPPAPLSDPEKETERNYLFFLTCLLSLFGTVLALVTSLFNLLYSYCVLLIPLRQLEKKRAILKEKVKLHRSVKVKSPRRNRADRNKSTKRHLSNKSEASHREVFSPSGLPNTTGNHKVHEWVYNHDISSEMSVSSQGTEMTANKAFLKEMLSGAAVSPRQLEVTHESTNISPRQQSTEKERVPEITVSPGTESNDTPYQRKKIGKNHETTTFSGGSSQGESSTHSEVSKETIPIGDGGECSKQTTPSSVNSSQETIPFSSESSQETSTLKGSLEVLPFNRNNGLRQSFRSRIPSFNRNESTQQSFRSRLSTSEVKDVHTALKNLDRALNGTLTPVPTPVPKDLPDAKHAKLDQNDGSVSEPESSTSYEIISSRVVSPAASPTSEQEARMTLNTSSFEIVQVPPDSQLNTSDFEVISLKLDTMTSSNLGSTSPGAIPSLYMQDLEATVSPTGSNGSQVVPDYGEVVVDGRPLSGVEGTALSKRDQAVPDGDLGIRNGAQLESESADKVPQYAALPRSRLSSAMIEDLVGQMASTKL